MKKDCYFINNSKFNFNLLHWTWWAKAAAKEYCSPILKIFVLKEQLLSPTQQLLNPEEQKRIE